MTIVVTDHTSAEDTRQALEARARRLMAERVALGTSRVVRDDRARYLGLIDDAIDEWASVA